MDVFSPLKEPFAPVLDWLVYFGEAVVVELLSDLGDVFLDGLIIEASSDINDVSDTSILALAKELK